jgi:asparagine synthase (glutamine-hydrolysing)
MCGIAGYFSFSKFFQPDDLKKMTDTIRHRGPDADGFFIDKVCGLGNRRLKILDLSDIANMPMTSHNENFVMTYNGEVYNFAEIKKDLSRPWHTQGDSEVILESFSEWGIDAMHRFNGMFAIALFDKKNQSLTLIRDRFGVKPVFYYWDGKNFAFASEIKALLELPILKEINKLALQDFLFLEYIPAPQTIFKNIFQLPAGHFLACNQMGVAVKKYYDIKEKLQKKSFTGLEDAEEEFESLLKTSVQYRLISDVPLGCFLSGGIDSSLISAVYKDATDADLESFTIGFDVPKFDETKYAQQVADILHTHHHAFKMTVQNATSWISDAAVCYDQPFAVPSVFPSLQLCKLSHENITVALSGDGGDELFMGYGYYNWFPRLAKLFRLGGNSLGFISDVLKQFDARGEKLSRIAKGHTDLWLRSWSAEQDMFTENEIGELLETKYVHETLLKEWTTINNLPISIEEKISLFDIENYLADDLLFKMDMASMHNSLEVRSPFLDYRLVEFAVNIPLEFKIKNGIQKFLPKKTLEKYLPNDLVYRKKWGFPAPVGDWLLNEWHFLLTKYLSTKVITKQHIFNSQVIKKIIANFESTSGRGYKRVWSLIAFQLWYEMYIDKNLCSD